MRMASAIKRVVFSLLLSLSFLGYVILVRFGARPLEVTEPSHSSFGNALRNWFSSGRWPEKTPQVPVYADGEYTGSEIYAYYGMLRVKAIVKSGKIDDVQVLEFPSDRATSIRVNAYAVPLLRTEAIQAQTSEVDIVSGATQTSAAFKESLASALALAIRQ